MAKKNICEIRLDRKSAKEGEYVTVTWNCEGPDAVSLTVDNGFNTTSTQLPDSGSRSMLVEKSKKETIFRLNASFNGKVERKEVKLKVDNFDPKKTRKTSSAHSNGTSNGKYQSAGNNNGGTTYGTGCYGRNNNGGTTYGTGCYGRNNHGGTTYGTGNYRRKSSTGRRSGSNAFTGIKSWFRDIPMRWNAFWQRVKYGWQVMPEKRRKIWKIAFAVMIAMWLISIGQRSGYKAGYEKGIQQHTTEQTLYRG